MADIRAMVGGTGVSATDTTPAAPSAWSPLRNTVYRSLFIAQLVSNIGGWMQTVGAQWFLVEREASTTIIAAVQTASLLPTLLLALLAGALADALDRRVLLIAVGAGSMLTGIVLTALAWTDTLSPWGLLACTFVLGCWTSLSAPAWQAIQPELVSREEIPAASALGSVTVNGARAVGPALAGVLVALAGPTFVFAINAASFLATLSVLIAWKRPKHPQTDREGLAESILSGVRYIRSGPIVRRIILRSALFAFPASALWALLPSASSSVLKLGSVGYGVLLGVLGVGAVIGVAATPMLRKRCSANTLLVGSAVGYGVGMAALAWLPLWAVVPALLLSGIAWITTLTALNASIQLSLATWVRARGMSVYLLVFMGSQAIGSLVWGWLASKIGIVDALAVAVAALAFVAASVAVLPLRPETGVLDRAVSMAWPTPTVMFEPDPDDGPVRITVTYRVVDDALEQFLTSMAPVGIARKRTGAYAWNLYRSLDVEDTVVEQFTVPSWSQYRRQREERWTGSDHDVVQKALTQTVDGATHTETHDIALSVRANPNGQ
ncbi:MFS transporter [Rhodococcus fascians]|nr:MFS transporter [Rhodococcus fascians]MBY4060310.1 MFS transporter [Rhodococcus fascians]MBY4070591.1 MFS transporter [Rhodococcus fascians]